MIFRFQDHASLFRDLLFFQCFVQLVSIQDDGLRLVFILILQPQAGVVGSHIVALANALQHLLDRLLARKIDFMQRLAPRMGFFESDRDWENVDTQCGVEAAD